MRVQFHAGEMQPSAVSPLVEIELREKRNVARHEKRLVYELNVLGQLVIVNNPHI